jgi:hypothetical protein
MKTLQVVPEAGSRGVVVDNRLSICLSTGLQKNLTKRQWQLVKALGKLIESEGIRVSKSLETDRIEERCNKVSRSQGALVAVFPQWEARRIVRDRQKTLLLPSEFSHIAIVMAVAAKKPLLVLRQKSVAERGSLRRGYVHPILDMPADVDADWIETSKFQGAFSQWLRQVKSQRHVFLGYSSLAKETAASSPCRRPRR